MFRSIAEFEKTAQPRPTTAEKALIAACRKGERCTIGEGTLPPEGNKDKALQIRASLLRLLIMGGTPECGLHESGIDLHGAHITETLDLRFAKGRGQLALDSCRFDKKLQLEQTQLDHLSLQDSHFPGLFAQGAKIAGTVFLRRVVTTGTVDVNRVEIGGSLTCQGASLDGSGGKALNAQGAKITGSVFLSAIDVAGIAIAFTAKGTVDVNTAEIGGQLYCAGASLAGTDGMALYAQRAKIASGLFLLSSKVAGTATPFIAKGTVDVKSAEIGGQLACFGASLDGEGGDALNAQGVRVQGSFIFREVESVVGGLDLITAHVSTLVDDQQCWQLCRDGLFIDGLTYDRIVGNTAPKTFDGRKDWLAKGSTHNGEFSPQP